MDWDGVVVFVWNFGVLYWFFSVCYVGEFESVGRGDLAFRDVESVVVGRGVDDFCVFGILFSVKKLDVVGGVEVYI